MRKQLKFFDLFYVVKVLVEAPRLMEVAAPAKFTVVALVFIKLKVASSVANAYFTPSRRNAISGGYVFSGASKCGTCPYPGMRCSRPLPLGILSAMNFMRA